MTYTIKTTDGQLYVDAWGQKPDDCMPVGEHVDLAVKVRCFSSKGGPRYGLVLADSDGQKGVAF